jgi:hypothetical protein
MDSFGKARVKLVIYDNLIMVTNLRHEMEGGPLMNFKFVRSMTMIQIGVASC